MQKQILSMLILAATALAGCSGGGSGSDGQDFTCPNGTVLHSKDFPDRDDAGFDLSKKCTTSTTTTKPGGKPTTTTPTTPNVAPTVVLKVTDATGNVTPVTLVGGSLFFDATGSADSDGTLSEVAIVAFDGNRSYSASLYSAGVFHVVNFTFDRAGPVNVTVSALDNRNAIGQMDTNVYVNKLMPVGPTSPPRLPYPPAVGPIPAADSCEPIDEEGLQDQQFVGSGTFDADVNTTYVTAHKTSGVDLQMVLCTPNVPGPSAPICPLGDDNADVRSDPGTIFVTPPGANKYILRLVAQQANPTGDLFTADVIIHYEPDPMAAAPAA